MFAAISFPGGGNRCYWQGGFYETVAPRLGLHPALRVGVSGGAFAACYTALGLGPEVRDLVFAACDGSRRNLDLRGALRGGPLFPVREMYRDLMRTVFTPERFAALRTRGDILIALARPPRGWPVTIAAQLGIAAYQAEKRFRQPVHPASGRRLGFTSEFLRVADLDGPEALAEALMASAAVPPFMPVGRVGGRPALDGGLYDNVPVAPLEPVEAQGGRTLVLLTRRYPRVSAVPNRSYVQPSRRIAVSQFAIDDAAGIRAAYELGVRDGETFLRQAG